MNKKYKSLFKDTIVFALGSLGSKVILFFLVPLYTNYLTTEEFGIADLVSTFSQLIIPITSLVIGSAVIRFGMKKTEKPEDVVVSAFIVLVISTIVTIALTPLLGLYKPISEWKYYLIILVIFSNFAEVEKTYLKVKNRNRTFSIISVFQTGILAVTNVLLLTVYRFGIRGYLISNISAAASGTLITFFVGGLYKDLKKGKLSFSLLKKMITFSIPLIFSNISWSVVHSSDKIMIECMINASVLGIYTAATKIPSLINVIIAIFNQAWGISSIKEIESSQETSFISSVFKLFNTFIFGSCLIFISFIKIFMSFYVGESFREAWQYTPLLLSAAVFFSISAFIGSLYVALQKTKNDMWTTVLCAITNVVVNFWGIRLFGIWGAVIGTVTAYFVCTSIRVFDIKKMMNIDIGISFWINVILMVFQTIVVTIQWHPIISSVIVIILYIFTNYFELIAIYKKMISIVSKKEIHIKE